MFTSPLQMEREKWSGIKKRDRGIGGAQYGSYYDNQTSTRSQSRSLRLCPFLSGLWRNFNRQQRSTDENTSMGGTPNFPLATSLGSSIAKDLFQSVSWAIVNRRSERHDYPNLSVVSSKCKYRAQHFQRSLW